MRILSLFDGISCGRVALQRAGINVERYVAYEIDEAAIIVSNWNYPDIEHKGSVEGADFTQYEGFDLVIGGSPCQGFSFAGKGLNFDDPRSKLFFDYVRAVDQAKPEYFLLENVRMKKESQDVITDILGVEPLMINSNLVSAQNRVRYYWTNIPGVELPKDRGIDLIDILEEKTYLNPGAFRGKPLNKATILGRKLNAEGVRKDYDKSIKTTQCLEVRATNTNKSNCLTTVQKDNVLTPLGIGRHPDAFARKLPYRNYTPVECERLQTLPDGYTEMVSDTQRYRQLGNGWTVDVIAHILNYINLDELL